MSFRKRTAPTPSTTNDLDTAGVPGSIDRTFTATLQKSPAKDGWTYVVTDWSAGFFGTGSLVKVAGTVDDAPFRGAFMPLGDGTHKLALKAGVRERIGKQAGDEVTVHLTERLA